MTTRHMAFALRVISVVGKQSEAEIGTPLTNSMHTESTGRSGEV